MAEIDLLKNSSFVDANKSIIERLDTQNALLATIASNNGGMTITSWADVQAIVRRGVAPVVFNIGDILSCQKNGKSLDWVIVDFDNALPADGSVKHTMTLQSLYTVANAPYDSNEALYYTNTQLAAGTYNVMLDGDFFTSGAGKYQFTLKNPVPAGGQIVLSWSTTRDITKSKIVTYSSAKSFSAIETAEITAGAGGTALTNLNNFAYVRNGDGAFSRSNIRGWLNASKGAGEWYTPVNNFDRISQTLNNAAGFLNGVDDDFKKALYRLPRTYKLISGGTVTLNDLVALPTKAELYGDMTNEAEGVKPFEYYKAMTTLSAAGNGADSGRIKYSEDGTARICALSTPYSEYQCYSLRANGLIVALSAATYMYYSPICTIA